jgi:hypothetical protein
VPVSVATVDATVRAFTEAGAAQAVGLGAHQGVDERRQQTAQVGVGVGEPIGQELVQVDIWAVAFAGSFLK